MPADERATWIEFYKLYPFDDFHRYQRPAAFIRSGMAGSYEAGLDFLAPEPTMVGLSAADVSMMRAMGFNRKGV